MRILYIHQYFYKPEQSGSLRSYFLSKALMEAGHEVELITAHNGAKYYREEVEGIKVHYLPVAYHNNFSFAQRIKSFFKFIWQSIQLAWGLKEINLCYVTSTPLTVGIIALVLKKFKNIPYYFEVRDLWPEAPIQLGFINNRYLIKLLYRFEKYIYQQAEKVVALSPGMQRGVELHKPAWAVSMIPNMADLDFYSVQSPTRTQFQDPFNICYMGAIGRANHLDFLIQIARACQEKKLHQIHFFIAGEGAEMRKLQQNTQSLQLKNVNWLGLLNRNQVREYLNKAHATYTSFDTFPILETNSPNKFFDSLAAGKFTIVNTKGWLAELVHQHKCGFYADPLKPNEFIKQLMPYLNDAVLLERALQHARELAETQFSRQVLTSEFVKLFNKQV